MRRRDNRHKKNGDQQDWCNRWARRAYRLTRRPGLGKYTKRTMARKRRRELQRGAKSDDGEEETLGWLGSLMAATVGLRFGLDRHVVAPFVAALAATHPDFDTAAL